MIIYKKIINEKGVSLLEMVVALALFAVIFLMASRIFLSVIEGQRNAIAGHLNQETMRYVFEMMSKEIRLAGNRAAGDCNAFGFPAVVSGVDNKVYNFDVNDLVFVNKDGQCVRYSRVESVDDKQIYIKRDGDLPLAVTADDILINKLNFDITDNKIGAIRTEFPRVTIRIETDIKEGKEMHKKPMILQTTVSSRRYQID